MAAGSGPASPDLRREIVRCCSLRLSCSVLHRSRLYR
jgi:hypothetical protein